MDSNVECWTYDFVNFDILKFRQTIYGLISTLLIFPFIIYLFNVSDFQDRQFFRIFSRRGASRHTFH